MKRVADLSPEGAAWPLSADACARERRRLYIFSPLPPQRNGLADYLLEYLPALARDFEVVLVAEAACLDQASRAIAAGWPSVRVVDEAGFLARQPDSGGQVLYNMGNNGDCVYMLDYLQACPGAVWVHDVSLFYLHQLMLQRTRADGLLGPWLAEEGHAVPGDFLRRDGALLTTPGLLYQECLMLRRVCQAAQAVMVHTRYAERRLRGAVQGLPLGDAAGKPWLRLPHFVLAPPELAAQRREEVLAGWHIAPEDCLMLVPGFLTGNKMLFEVLAAFRAMQAQCPRARLLFAGEERPEEYPLSARIAQWWPQGGGPEVTGYLDAQALDVLLGRADLSFVLRYPTYGESSGILPRAALGGGQVLTVDIGAYPEFASPQVQAVPVGPGCVQALAEGMARAYHFWQSDSPAARAQRQAQESQRQQSLSPRALYPALRDWLDRAWRGGIP